VWGSVVDGQTLTFRLTGINNQNFVMQDEQTGSWWQQVSGEAIQGPLKGKKLTLIEADQLMFATWRSESPTGRVLAPVPAILAKGGYAPIDWEASMARNRVPARAAAAAAADARLQPRALVIGIERRGEARAFPVEQVSAAGVVLDEVGGTPIAIVRAPDGRSTRVFDRRIDGTVLELFAKVDAAPFRFVDAASGSEFDFTGTAVSGTYAGRTLARVPFLEEYWFDWKNYHPQSDIAR
jgi:Protein of unknown function (DUF3179)